jgi:hypothetical protein
MAAVLVQIADEVVDLLNTVPSPFSQSFTAERRYPNLKVPLTRLNTLRVDVCGSSHQTTDLESHESVSFECRVAIVIRKRFGQSARQEEDAEGRPVGNEAIDELVLLVEEIVDYLYTQANRRLTDAADANRDMAIDNVLIQNTFVDQHLQDYDQFTGIIRATYTASVDV